MIGDTSDVRRIFDESLTNRFKAKPEVLNYLLNHDRKKVCLDNLCAEIVRMNGRRLLVELSTFKEVIETTADMFASRALKFAEQEAVSSLERIRRQSEADRMKNAEGLIHEFEKDGVLKKIKTES